MWEQTLSQNGFEHKYDSSQQTWYAVPQNLYQLLYTGNIKKKNQISVQTFRNW